MTLYCVTGIAFADDAQPPKPSDAAAGMLDAMREKGIITEAEYEDLYKRQALYEMEQKEASALPAWLRDWTFGGDAGVRFDEVDRGGKIKLNKPLFSSQDPVNLTDGTASAKRDRFRFRLRLGAERKLGDDFLVGFRIATAQASAFGVDASSQNTLGVNFSRRFNTDPRSAWVTAGDYFAPKGIAVDRIYIQWAPHLVDGLSFQVGKMENAFWSRDFSGDIMVWDHDISPEGGLIQYGHSFFGERMWVHVRGSYFQVDEVPNATIPGPLPATDGSSTFPPDVDEKDPFMYAAQVDFSGDVTPWLRAGARVSYYDVKDVNMRFAAASEDLGNGGASIKNNPLLAIFTPALTDGRSRGEMREIVYDMFMKFTPWEGWSLTPWFQLTHMFEVSSENYGYDTGFDLLAPTNTKLTFMWASMPRNGTMAVFTDSDFFDGYTNARGWGLSLEQAINRWVSLRGSYLSSTERSKNCGAFEGSGASQLCDTAFWGGTPPSALGNFRRQVLDRDRILVDLLVKF
ncbi:MAG TPA: putative porin [Myxococcota bacterium]|nr:putative porin [Myxococcota bacterium]